MKAQRQLVQRGKKGKNINEKWYIQVQGTTMTTGKAEI